MEVSVCQYGADKAALRGTDQAVSFYPVEIHVSCIQKFPDQVEKSLIRNLLVQNSNQGLVLQLIEAGVYVPFDKPVDSLTIFLGSLVMPCGNSGWVETRGSDR